MENKLQIDTLSLSEILIKEQKFCTPFFGVFLFLKGRNKNN
jgi:hypothetical protein